MYILVFGLYSCYMERNAELWPHVLNDRRPAVFVLRLSYHYDMLKITNDKRALTVKQADKQS